MPYKKRKTRARFQPYPMTDVDQKSYSKFSNSGRTGRRNALADILDSNHGKTSTSSLPLHMEKLKCSDSDSEAGKSDSACADPLNNEDKATASTKDKKDSDSEAKGS